MIALFVVISRSNKLDTTHEDIQSERTGVQEGLKDSILRTATPEIALIVDDYYIENESGVFETDPSARLLLNDYIRKIKAEKDMDIEANVYSSTAHYAVKVREKGSDSFYCVDTTGDMDTDIIETGKDFDAKTDCSGNILE